jgi:hypothetical protein
MPRADAALIPLVPTCTDLIVETTHPDPRGFGPETEWRRGRPLRWLNSWLSGPGTGRSHLRAPMSGDPKADHQCVGMASATTLKLDG